MAEKKGSPKKSEAVDETKGQSRRGKQPPLNAAEVKALARKYKLLAKQALDQVDRAARLLEACEAEGKAAVIHPATKGIDDTLAKLIRQTHWFQSMATTATTDSGIDPSKVD